MEAAWELWKEFVKKRREWGEARDKEEEDKER